MILVIAYRNKTGLTWRRVNLNPKPTLEKIQTFLKEACFFTFHWSGASATDVLLMRHTHLDEYALSDLSGWVAHGPGMIKVGYENSLNGVLKLPYVGWDMSPIHIDDIFLDPANIEVSAEYWMSGYGKGQLRHPRTVKTLDEKTLAKALVKERGFFIALTMKFDTGEVRRKQIPISKIVSGSEVLYQRTLMTNKNMAEEDFDETLGIIVEVGVKPPYGIKAMEHLHALKK